MAVHNHHTALTDCARVCSAVSQTDKERFTGGGSGAFLYFSQDRRFIVKTLSQVSTLHKAHTHRRNSPFTARYTLQPEAKVLLEILPAYVNYMKRNPHTLVAKFLGCHSIRMYRRTMFFVVMENVLNSERKQAHTHARAVV